MIVHNIGIMKARVNSNVLEPVLKKSTGTYMSQLKFIDYDNEILKELQEINVDLGTGSYTEAVKKANDLFKYCKEELKEYALVNILFDLDTKMIYAISLAGNEDGKWIDVYENFIPIEFRHLYFDINRLVVY